MSKKQSAKSSSSVDHDAIAKLSWEEAIERLEEINDAIESGELGLERSIDAYEEGVALRAHCESILERAELRVTKLSPKDDDSRDDSGSGHPSSDEPDEPAPF
ncbi:MAG: exodeoxyribonuclease VII small subunit [Phycisphaerales bacterium JB065]